MIATDILPMDPPHGVEAVRDDFRDAAVFETERVLKPGGGALINVFRVSGLQE